MDITKEHKQVALIEIDIDRKYHTRDGLYFNKLGKLLFSKKIAQTIYSILRNKPKQSTRTSEKYWVQRDGSEVDGINSHQGNKDISNDRNSDERFNLDEDESTRDNNGDKNDKEKFRQINFKAIVSQELECDCEEEGVNIDETVILGQTQVITDNTQSGSVDKTVETRKTSTRNKKTPRIRGNDFLWLTSFIDPLQQISITS